MADLHKIPFELLVQILSRLPPKSLMRFKCIRKSFDALVNNPQFAVKHLHYYNERSSSTCILFRRTAEHKTENDKQQIYFSFLHLRYDNDVDDDDDHSLHFSLEDIHFPLSMGLKVRGPFIELPDISGTGVRDESVTILAHCDGIFCLSLYGGNLVLYNPGINEFKIIPESCLRDGIGFFVGFGFDPKSKDYLLVRIVSFKDLYDGEYEDHLVIQPPKAEVYTLSANSWREVNADNLHTETRNIFGLDCQTCFKGIFYWKGYDEPREYMSSYDRDVEDLKYLVILFDACDRVFHSVKLPECFYQFPLHEFILTVWNNSVVLYGFYRGGDQPFEIWGMDDFATTGVKCSWTKHISIVPTLKAEIRVPLILGLWKSDEVLLLAKNGCLVSYNFVTDKLKHLPIHYLSHGNYNQVVCKRSIVSVKGGNKFESKDVISN
ncbi:F-box/kelch-repeat protein [Rosa sericea]